MTAKSPPQTPYQRAAQAPELPNTPLQFVLYFVRRKWPWFAGMFALETINATCGILIPTAISEVIRTIMRVGTGGNNWFELLKGPLLLFLGLSLGEVLFSRAAGTLQFYFGPLQRQSVTRALFAYLQHHSQRYFSNNFAGALAHRVGETALGVNQLIWAIIFDFWPVAIVLSVSSAILFRTHTYLALFVSAWAILFVTISWWLATRCRPYAVKAAGARSETTGKLVDSVTNFSSARLFARMDFERSYLDGYMETELRALRKSMWYSERVRWFQFVSAAILKVGTLAFAVLLWSRGEIGVPEFVLATSLSLLIINEARNLSRRFLEFFEFVGNITNGVNTLLQSHELIDVPHARHYTINQGHIEFRDLSFNYNNEIKVFDALNIRIKAGQRVGLVGFSGSGKSTFVNLVLRFFDPQEGGIFVDGVDIRELTQDSLHSQIGLIPQDPSLYHRTLMENIRYGRLDATDEEVIEAARKAHAHDFIIKMREGYQSMVGERGVKLSGGQRQRIAIARVILKNAPILILDEATSSLDSITEQAIQEALDQVMEQKTVIVVAHRLSTIAHLDRILVFDGGRIVEDGSHGQLLAKGGAYYRLWTRQADGFIPDDSENQPAKDPQEVGGDFVAPLPLTDSEPDLPGDTLREDTELRPLPVLQRLVAAG